MKNIFCTVYDKTTKKNETEYEPFVIRKVSNNQEERINSLFHKYKTGEANGFPRWLNITSRLAFSATACSFIFLLLNIISSDVKMKDYLWIIIIFSISFFLLIFTIIIGVIMRRKNKKNLKKTSAADIFISILETSKGYLGVPKDAKSLEVLMEQKNGASNHSSVKKYNNILLSVFIENDKLCFADLYVVIGLPLSSFKKIEKEDMVHRFSFWHKKHSILEYKEKGLHQISIPVRCYQANYYYTLCFEIEKEEYAVCVPLYEIDAYQEVLNLKGNEES